MPSVNIPREALPALKKILEMDEAKFASLLTALREVSPTLTQSEFCEKVASRLQDIKSDELRSMLRTLFVLYVIKYRSSFSAQEIADEVGKSAVESSSDSMPFPPNQRDFLSNRLKQLLGFEKTLAVTAKAIDEMTEHEHTYCRARILSDIRPVFTDMLDSASAAVIIHTLQIGYHHSGEHKEFYVAMDTD